MAENAQLVGVLGDKTVKLAYGAYYRSPNTGEAFQLTGVREGLDGYAICVWRSDEPFNTMGEIPLGDFIREWEPVEPEDSDG